MSPKTKSRIKPKIIKIKPERQSPGLRWCKDVRKRAKEIYIAWTGDPKAAMEHVRIVLRKELTTAPHLATLYRWATTDKWEEARKEKELADGTRAVAEMIGTAAETVAHDPGLFLDVLTRKIMEDIESLDGDQQMLRMGQSQILERLRKGKMSNHELSGLVHALAHAVDSRARRPTTIARVLQAIATGLEARAQLIGATASGTICNAISDPEADPPDTCPIIRAVEVSMDEKIHIAMQFLVQHGYKVIPPGGEE